METSNQPALLFPLPDNLAAIIDKPIDAINIAALQSDLFDVHRRRVVGTKDRCLDARGTCVSGHGGAGIAIGGHGEMIDAEFLRHGNGKGKAPRLERACGQTPLVFHNNIRPAAHRDERRHHFAQRNLILRMLNRQELTVAPETFRAFCQRFFGNSALQCFQIITHQQRLSGFG